MPGRFWAAAGPPEATCGGDAGGAAAEAQHVQHGGVVQIIVLAVGRRRHAQETLRSFLDEQRSGWHSPLCFQFVTFKVKDAS
jgi:hypothetical protein